MSDRKVVVQGGGKNLYKISDYSGKFSVYKIDVGLIFDDSRKIGSARSLDDALSIIRSHSGKQIERIDNW